MTNPFTSIYSSGDRLDSAGNWGLSEEQGEPGLKQRLRHAAEAESARVTGERAAGRGGELQIDDADQLLESLRGPSRSTIDRRSSASVNDLHTIYYPEITVITVG